MDDVILAWRRLSGLLRQPRLAYRIYDSYYKTHRRLPRLFPPHTYNEKIQYRKLFDRRPYLKITSDKYAVRGYVREKIGLDLFPRIYHLTQDPSTIPFDALPERFVVKPTHGSGWIQLVTDKSQLDRGELMARCREWLSEDYSQFYNEWFYRDIPRRIIVEEFIDAGGGFPPSDVKLLVFNQRVKIVQIDTDRCGSHRRNFFDIHWNEIGVVGKRVRGIAPVQRPSRLEDMIRYAETLSQDMDMVRVDLYQLGDRIYFGEMTHTPASGLDCLEPPGTDEAWGDLWEMDFEAIHEAE